MRCTVDPEDPTRVVTDESRGLRVWAYRERPILTCAGDSAAVEANGHRWMYGVSGFRLVEFYGDDPDAH